MKATKTTSSKFEVAIHGLRLILPVRYGEEDIPKNFPGRSGDTWIGCIEVDTGRLIGWPITWGAAELNMKVCDEGRYQLIDQAGNVISEISDGYVPEAVPSSYGDYVELKIGADGIVNNWNKNPDLKAFPGFEEAE